MKIMIGIFVLLVAVGLIVYREQIGKGNRYLSKEEFQKRTKLGLAVILLLLIGSLLCFESIIPAAIGAFLMGLYIIGDTMNW